MRKSIFDIATENINMESEVNRLITMSVKEDMLFVETVGDRTLFDYVNDFCFNRWSHRGHFLDVDDFLQSLNFDNLKQKATNDQESFLSLIELIYNFWELADEKLCDSRTSLFLEPNDTFFHLKYVMDDILQQYNHVAYIDKERECVLIVEDNSEVTAVVEIMPTSGLAFDVVRYNHHALKGEIEVKKKILLLMGTELEAKRKLLHAINPTLEDDIFFMLNNLNIRHNNKSKGDKNYKEYVAKMRKDRLEKWYDELYQMILLAFLLLDNTERAKEVKGLKEKIDAK